MLPVFVKRHNVDVGVRNVGADYLEESALPCHFLYSFCDFLCGLPEGEIIFFGEFVDFVTFEFWNDKSVKL